MTFLQLVQKLAQYAGVASAPSAVTGQTGEALSLVNYINAAWLEIQGMSPDWQWMRSQASVQTTASDRSYAPTDFTDVPSAAAISAFSRWLPRTFSIYLTSAGQSTERDLQPLDYNVWRRIYDFGATASQTDYPVEFAINPADSSILLGKTPDAIYTVRGDYMKRATELSADGSVPGLPEQYHMVIVWRALMMYGHFENAAETHEMGRVNFNRMMPSLEINQLPIFSYGSTLVR